MKYYIASLKWSAETVMWWRPDNAGYTRQISEAGLYSQEQIDARPNYYNNKDTTLAVPQEIVDLAADQVVLKHLKRLLEGEAETLQAATPLA